ncbi:hypothetical protein SAMD00019534_051440 [Acytostelium subglobosum LB1]|uniref:hypothetical protein n=1 Tax=Acytostelium subglobosum LB1 TaxID=1410327 RepID=UPI0006449506|nr:hypothetical protein SAMD00019534_051440 [Acytostelium subglobosum LB1]GAM21969.1 hypothetical protein SAMD00019534_051440 [Acytostelium subglobosum LB1]|eukprot:XP_012755069.1 hypothetical protein SAMD00019534_051440 [Acytostelium subglobosum LB1]
MQKIQIVFMLLAFLACLSLANAALQTRAYASASGKALTSLTIVKPTGTIAGDVLIAHLSNRNNVAAVMTPPTGWSLIRSDQTTSAIKSWMYYRVATISEPASYTFTIDLASYIAGSIVSVIGADAANPINAHSGQKNGNSYNFNTPALSTTVADTMALWFGDQVWTGAACPNAITEPTGYTELFDTCLVSSSTGIIFDAATKILATPGLQTAANGVSPFNQTNIAQVVALTPAVVQVCTVADTYSSTVVVVGNVAAPGLIEPSGIATSRLNPGVAYIHNEDTTALIAISTSTGATLGSFTVSNMTPLDWEDIACGPCPAGKCIYAGDTGSSPTPKRTSYAVYRMTEPNIAGGLTSGTLAAEQFPYVYPGAATYDCESLAVHPVTGDIYVMTKAFTAGISRVFKFPNPLPAPGTMSTLTLVATIQLPMTSDYTDSQVTAAAIHPCGNRVLFRTYHRVYEFRAAAGAAFETAFSAAPVTLTDTVETQGESIDYDPTGNSYYTMSEVPTPYKLKRVDKL